jgi:CheY-like chemotaxis protein
MRLLIVDDNTRMRGLIKSLLAGLAEEIYECSDGGAALEIYGRHLPDWVLMDIELEEMDGLTASQQLLSDYPAARVLIVTSHDDDDLREQAQQIGACGYILKENLWEVRQLLGSRAV